MIRRVAQWATGNIGTRSLRAVIDHPQLELVAAHVYGAAKAGVDAGELCGRPPTGVVTTTDPSAVLAAAPDCVLHMARAFDPDEVCPLLEAGIHVVTTRGELHRPASMDPALRARVEAACTAGGAAIHSTGSSPGFITEALPIVLTSLQRRLELLAIEEFADLSRRPSPELLFDVMGFAREPGAMHPARLEHGKWSFGPSLQILADHLGLAHDGLEASGSFAVARRDLQIAAGGIPAGTVAGQRTEVAVTVGGRPAITFAATWYCTTDLEPAWDLRDTGWRLQVHGDAPLDVDVRFPFPLDEMAEHSPGYTAHRAVNAVDAVCTAQPGIRTTFDLPQVVARL